MRPSEKAPGSTWITNHNSKEWPCIILYEHDVPKAFLKIRSSRLALPVFIMGVYKLRWRRSYELKEYIPSKGYVNSPSGDEFHKMTPASEVIRKLAFDEAVQFNDMTHWNEILAVTRQRRRPGGKPNRSKPESFPQKREGGPTPQTYSKDRSVADLCSSDDDYKDNLEYNGKSETEQDNSGGNNLVFRVRSNEDDKDVNISKCNRSSKRKHGFGEGLDGNGLCTPEDTPKRIKVDSVSTAVSATLEDKPKSDEGSNIKDEVILYLDDPPTKVRITREAALRIPYLVRNLATDPDTAQTVVSGEVLSNLTVDEFLPIAQFLESGEYDPELLETKPPHLKGVRSEGQHEAAALAAGALWNRAKDLEFTDMMVLVKRKIEAQWPLAPDVLLMFTRLVFFTEIKESRVEMELRDLVKRDIGARFFELLECESLALARLLRAEPEITGALGGWLLEHPDAPERGDGDEIY